MTFEEIFEIMHCEPNEIIECEDGIIMNFVISSERDITKESEEEYV